MKKQSLKAVLKNIQQKLAFGNSNLNRTQNDLDKMWEKKHNAMWGQCIANYTPEHYKINVLSRMAFLCLLTNTDMKIDLDIDLDDESQPKQLKILIRCIEKIRKLGYSPKESIYQIIKERASVEKGYFNERGKFTKIRGAYSVQDAKNKYLDLSAATFEKTKGGWNVLEVGEFINKYYKPKFVKPKKRKINGSR